jgi:hypothetical protein
MRSERAVVAGLLAQIIAVAVLAQEAPASTPISSSEFGRGSGGQIEVLTRHSNRLSGSLGMRFSGSQTPFGSGSRGYEATVGGALAEDRIWFFGSILRDDALPLAAPRAISTPVASSAEMGKLDAQIGDRNSLAALFAAGRTAGTTSLGDQTPSSFLSLHYTGIVSSNVFFTASYARSAVADPQTLP